MKAHNRGEGPRWQGGRDRAEEVQKSQLPPALLGFTPSLSADSALLLKFWFYEFVFNRLASVLQQRAVNQTRVCCDLCRILGFQGHYNLNVFKLIILYVKINLVTFLFKTKNVWSVCQHPPQEAREQKCSGVLLHSVVLWC